MATAALNQITKKVETRTLKTLTGLNLRLAPNSSAGIIKTIAKGTTVCSRYSARCPDTFSGNGKGIWYYIDTLKGWMCYTDGSKFFMRDTKAPTDDKDDIATAKAPTMLDSKTKGKKPTNKDLTDMDKQANNAYSEYMNDTLTMYNATYKNNSKLAISDLRGIYGLPYSFLDTADLPIEKFSREIASKDRSTMSTSPFGLEFTENIVAKMPLLTLSPGRAAYMAGFTIKDKKNFASYAKSILKGDLATQDLSMTDVLKKDGRYYSFEYNYKDFFEFVNAMCQAQAKLMKLNKKYYIYDWSNYTSSSVKGFFSGNEYICFYIEAENQISESFSNNVGESKLAGLTEGGSDFARELDQVLGVAAGVKIDEATKDKWANDLDTNGLNSYGSVFESIKGRLKNGFTVVSQGGNLIFPEIWRESSYAKSYSVTVKLQSPDGDDESVFLNIFVPMWHLLGFVLPKQLGANGMRAPFLVRGNYKGIFNVEMGIIPSMNIRKGNEGTWNASGLPTEMEITFDIKDLYEALTMTNPASDGGPMAFLNNMPMMDFIATMSGININKPDFLRKFDMYLTSKYARIRNMPRQLWLEMNQMGSNLAMKLFGQ